MHNEKLRGLYFSPNVSQEIKEQANEMEGT